MNTKKNWETYRLRIIIISLIIMLIGVILIIISYNIPIEKRISIFTISSIGTTLITVGIISFLYEVLLRKNFIEVTESSISKVIENKIQSINETYQQSANDITSILNTKASEQKIEIEKSLVRIIKDSMPPKYINIKRVGIVDAYDFLELEKLKQKIERLENEEFRILKMWTPTLNLIETTIIDAIDKRNCNFRIALLNPMCREAIEKRASSLMDYDTNQIVAEIIKNLKRCKSIYNRLNNKNRFEVRIYDAFISIPIYGYGSKYIMGLYLHNRLSESGVQMKISGETSKLYQRLKSHFESIWKLSEIVDFDNEDCIDKIIRNAATNTG